LNPRGGLNISALRGCPPTHHPSSARAKMRKSIFHSADTLCDDIIIYSYRNVIPFYLVHRRTSHRGVVHLPDSINTNAATADKSAALAARRRHSYVLSSASSMNAMFLYTRVSRRRPRAKSISPRKCTVRNVVYCIIIYFIITLHAYASTAEHACVAFINRFTYCIKLRDNMYLWNVFGVYLIIWFLSFKREKLY